MSGFNKGDLRLHSLGTLLYTVIHVWDPRVLWWRLPQGELDFASVTEFEAKMKTTLGLIDAQWGGGYDPGRSRVVAYYESEADPSGGPQGKKKTVEFLPLPSVIEDMVETMRAYLFSTLYSYSAAMEAPREARWNAVLMEDYSFERWALTPPEAVSAVADAVRRANEKHVARVNREIADFWGTDLAETVRDLVRTYYGLEPKMPVYPEVDIEFAEPLSHAVERDKAVRDFFLARGERGLLEGVFPRQRRNHRELVYTHVWRELVETARFLADVEKLKGRGNERGRLRAWEAAEEGIKKLAPLANICGLEAPALNLMLAAEDLKLGKPDQAAAEVWEAARLLGVEPSRDRGGGQGGGDILSALSAIANAMSGHSSKSKSGGGRKKKDEDESNQYMRM